MNDLPAVVRGVVLQAEVLVALQRSLTCWRTVLCRVSALKIGCGAAELKGLGVVRLRILLSEVLAFWDSGFGFLPSTKYQFSSLSVWPTRGTTERCRLQKPSQNRKNITNPVKNPISPVRALYHPTNAFRNKAPEAPYRNPCRSPYQSPESSP